MDKWYILFIKTGRENKIMQLLDNRLEKKSFKPFVPKKVMLFKRHGFVIEHEYICFPGYIFVQSKLGMEDFQRSMTPVIRSIDDAYKLLSYGEQCDIVLHDEEKLMLKKLLGNTHCIDYSKGVIEGGVVKINSGALVGLEGQIKKINRHRREAEIDLKIMGDCRRINVGLEIVSKNI